MAPPPSEAARVSRVRVRLRLTSFLVLVVLLQVSPFLVQVVEVRNKEMPLLMGWRMYRQVGSNICAVHYELRTPDGVRRLDLDELRPSRRRIVAVEDAEKIGRSHCATLGADADVRLFARCGHARRGWLPKASGESNLCGSNP